MKNNSETTLELEKLKKAAHSGDVNAQSKLGLVYAAGNGTPQNYQEAFKWFYKAAQSGEPNAQYNLGVMYAEGDGVIQDYKEALIWLKKSAAKENPNAQYNLGVIYRNGEGISQNYQEAVKWYQKAAAQGHQKAKENLNLMYANGEAIKQGNENLEISQMSYLDEVFFDRLKNHYIDFNGKATRKVYWGFGIFISLIWISFFALFLLFGAATDEAIFFSSVIFLAALLLPSLSVTIGRLHDINMSGWALLLAFIPILGNVFMLAIALIPSKSPTRWD